MSSRSFGSRKKLIVILTSVVLTAVVLAGGFFFMSKANKLWRQTFSRPYHECEPERLLPELESWLDINFPEEIEQVKTARTSGTWDSPMSDFAVRLLAEPNTVDSLLDTLSLRTTLEAYKPEDDDRNVAASRRKKPKWFTQTIREGKKAGYHSQLEVYIDTTNARQFVVYIRGYYPRDPNEIAEELEYIRGS